MRLCHALNGRCDKRWETQYSLCGASKLETKDEHPKSALLNKFSLSPQNCSPTPKTHTTAIIIATFSPPWIPVFSPLTWKMSGRCFIVKKYAHFPVILLCVPYLAHCICKKVEFPKYQTFTSAPQRQRTYYNSARVCCRRGLLKITLGHNYVLWVWSRGLFVCVEFSLARKQFESLAALRPNFIPLRVSGKSTSKQFIVRPILETTTLLASNPICHLARLKSTHNSLKVVCSGRTDSVWGDVINVLSLK